MKTRLFAHSYAKQALIALTGGVLKCNSALRQQECGNRSIFDEIVKLNAYDLANLFSCMD